jgi:hypothetical protein
MDGSGLKTNKPTAATGKPFNLRLGDCNGWPLRGPEWDTVLPVTADEPRSFVPLMWIFSIKMETRAFRTTPDKTIQNLRSSE